MQTKTKLSLAAAALPCAAFAFFTQYPAALARPERTQDHTVILADIPGIAEANPRFSDLTWLGSHDCFSDQIRYRSAMDPRERGQLFARFPVRALTRGIAARYSKTQNIGAAEQLRAGARLLDIRLTWYKGEYYTRHSIISGRFEPYLREILRYLGDPAHAGEIVMLYVLSACFDQGMDYAHLFEWLAGIREGGKCLFDFIPYAAQGRKLADLRYNEVTGGGAQAGAVLLLHESALQSSIDHSRCFTITDNFIAPWANRIRDTDMLAFYAEQERAANALRQAGEQDKLYIMQAQKTLCLRNIREFVWTLKGFSLLDLARDSNAKLVTQGILDRWFTGSFQILLVDHINSQKAQFNTVINRKIRAFNEAAVRSAAART